MVDDGSTDGSAAVIASFGDPRVRAFSRDTASGGPAVPRNLAIATQPACGSPSWRPTTTGARASRRCSSRLLAMTRRSYTRAACSVKWTPGVERDFHERAGLDRLPTGHCVDDIIRQNFVPLLDGTGPP